MIVAVATLIAAVFIMSKGLGLSDELDFGAGSYYYADIPEFDKHVNAGRFESGVPWWLVLGLFALWGVVVWFLWKWVDGRK